MRLQSLLSNQRPAPLNIDLSDARSNFPCLDTDCWQMQHEDWMLREIGLENSLLSIFAATQKAQPTSALNYPIIDLGNRKAEYGRDFLSAGFPCYYALDLHHCGDGFQQVAPGIEFAPSTTTEPIHLVRGEMLNFLRSLKNESANLIISGIDSLIIGDIRFHAILKNEILRVLPVGGVAFINNSTINYGLYNQCPDGFRVVSQDSIFELLLFKDKSLTE